MYVSVSLEFRHQVVSWLDYSSTAYKNAPEEKQTTAKRNIQKTRVWGKML